MAISRAAQGGCGQPLHRRERACPQQLKVMEHLKDCAAAFEHK